MPKSKKPPYPVVAQPDGPTRPQATPLNYEERVHLSKLLSDPIFVMAWKNAELGKPPFFTASKEEAYYEQSCAQRLHQLQGWELFKAALLKQVDDPKPKPERLTESFPDSGTLEAEVKKRLTIQTK